MISIVVKNFDIPKVTGRSMPTQTLSTWVSILLFNCDTF